MCNFMLSNVRHHVSTASMHHKSLWTALGNNYRDNTISPSWLMMQLQEQWFLQMGKVSHRSQEVVTDGHTHPVYRAAELSPAWWLGRDWPHWFAVTWDQCQCQWSRSGRGHTVLPGSHQALEIWMETTATNYCLISGGFSRVIREIPQHSGGTRTLTTNRRYKILHFYLILSVLLKYLPHNSESKV